MPEHFAQTDPGPGFTIDLTGMGDAIWGALIAHLGELGVAIWTGLAQWMYGLLRGLVMTVWRASLLPIPHDATDTFGPVQAMLPGTGALAAAGITLALALIGLRTILDAVWGRHSLADYLLGRFIVWVGVLSVLPWLIGWSIDQEQALARSVVVGDLAGILPEQAAPNPLALFIMLVLGLRLWLKLASNVVHVAVAIVWAPVAAVCGLIPATSHIAGLWAHEFFGRLAGAVLATVASGVGLGIALTNTGDFAIFGVAGAFIAAHDMVDWLARTPGTSVGGVVGGMIRTGAAGAALLGGFGGGAAAALASGPASGGQAAMLSNPALPAARAMAMYSFD